MPQHVGFAFVLAGALGNVVDRAVRGYVVDFIHVRHWPVFNVADSAITLGVVMLLAQMLARERHHATAVAAHTPAVDASGVQVDGSSAQAPMHDPWAPPAEPHASPSATPSDE